MPKRNTRTRLARGAADGMLRHSQVITTYGPGALVDLVDGSVVIGGTDYWNFGKRERVIEEHRLRNALAPVMEKLDVHLSVSKPFREPPVGDDEHPSPASGIQAVTFPRWMVCQNSDCRELHRIDELTKKSSKSGYHHRCRDGNESPAVPVRFVAACPRGHLHDFPWRDFAHLGSEHGSCMGNSLRLIEGSSGDVSDISVTCDCGAARPLVEAFTPSKSLTCGGERPWLGAHAKEECGEPRRLLLRNATNSYFAQVVSALSIPESEDPIQAVVAQQWDKLEEAKAEDLGQRLKLDTKLRTALASFGEAEVMAAIEQQRGERKISLPPLRLAEYQQFLRSREMASGELPQPEDTFFSRRVRTGAKSRILDCTVAVSRLREVRAQVGFTRLDPISPNSMGEYDLAVKSASIGLRRDWLPAVELRGEGLFFSLGEEKIRKWEARPEVQSLERELEAGHARWCEGIAAGARRPDFPGARFYFLHSLSHLMISAIALDCGYAASALRERIYCAGQTSPHPMAGILICTGSSSSEGTLGGLASQAKSLLRHLQQAWDLGRLCSNDPVCAQHSPIQPFADRNLEGAACHSCLFIAESSCERFNQGLDRRLVVPTLGNDPALAFFTERPS